MTTHAFRVAAPMKHAVRMAAVAGSLAVLALARPVCARQAEGEVVRGDVSIAQQGSNTIINASDGAIINHPSFNIDEDGLAIGVELMYRVARRLLVR